MTSIVIDLETIGTDDPSAVTVKPPGNLKKPESIAKWEAEEKPQAILDALAKTAFDGTYGRIVCIGFQIDDGPAIAHCQEDEGDLLRWLFDEITQATKLTHYSERVELTVIGHNVAGFDLPFLKKRSLILSIKPPMALRKVFAAKPWGTEIADTMLMWDSDREKRISLDRLCKVLGVESPKNGFDGSQVAEAFKASEHMKIADYCTGDVSAAYACWRKLAWMD